MCVKEINRIIELWKMAFYITLCFNTIPILVKIIWTNFSRGHKLYQGVCGPRGDKVWEINRPLCPLDAYRGPVEPIPDPVGPAEVSLVDIILFPHLKYNPKKEQLYSRLSRCESKLSYNLLFLHIVMHIINQLKCQNEKKLFNIIFSGLLSHLGNGRCCWRCCRCCCSCCCCYGTYWFDNDFTYLGKTMED